eukprot:15348518-Ditylum_brightwellii.AAC.2
MNLHMLVLNLCKFYTMSVKQSDYGRNEDDSLTDTFTGEDNNPGFDEALGQDAEMENGGDKR